MGTIRKTKSIYALLNEFTHDSGAISAIDLIKRLSDRINKTTVYRVLDRLEDDGVLHSFLGSNGIKWYAKCKDCSSHGHFDVHPHFQCFTCGKVECLNIEIKIPDIPNKKVLASQLLIQGNCESCA